MKTNYLFHLLLRVLWQVVKKQYGSVKKEYCMDKNIIPFLHSSLMAAAELYLQQNNGNSAVSNCFTSKKEAIVLLNHHFGDLYLSRTMHRQWTCPSIIAQGGTAFFIHFNKIYYREETVTAKMCILCPIICLSSIQSRRPRDVNKIIWHSKCLKWFWCKSIDLALLTSTALYKTTHPMMRHKKTSSFSFSWLKYVCSVNTFYHTAS